MTKRNFDIKKIQKKSVKTVWNLMIRQIQYQHKGIYIYYRGHLLRTTKRRSLRIICEEENLVTVKQILEAIR